MDMNHIRTFIAAYEEASFTKAAYRLNSTQPGVSVQIAALEQTLGTSLFERNTRSITPTVAGTRLYPRALKLVHDLKSAAQEVRALLGAVTGRVSVGIPPAVSKAILAPVTSRYLDIYPEVELRIVDRYSDTLLSLVKRGELDFAIVASVGDDQAVNYRRVFRDRFVLASGTHSGLPAGKTIALNEEPYFKIIVPSVLRHALRQILEDSLRREDIIPARLVEIDGLAGALDMVTMTDWVALLPAATSRTNDPQKSGVQFNPIAGDPITIDYFVANSRTQPLSVAAQAFADLASIELEQVVAQSQHRAPAARARRKV